ncbi:MAG: PTS sugar transporter subunit IIB [Defluviitaleaceae bacterium]|nr:PTS sugar transporter subunit IIB [Defluviitaleaceae bacterium]
MSSPYFVVVCTFGAGSSLMLRLNVEAALKELGCNDFKVEVSDMGSCKNKNPSAYLCSTVLLSNLESQNPGAPVVGIKDFYNKQSLQDAVKPFLSL